MGSDAIPSRLDDEEEAIARLEAARWAGGVICPHCGSRHVRRMGGKTQAGMYLCNHCRDKFTARTGTAMERSHIPVYKWYRAVDLLNSATGMSARALQRELDVTSKTARYLMRRIREAKANIPGARRRVDRPSRPRRGRGRPPYIANPTMRKSVLAMCAHGIPRAEIGRAITPPCSVNTLVKAYGEELQRGRALFKYRIALSAEMHLVGRPAEYDAAGNCLRKEVKPSLAMAIFLAKAVLGLVTTAPRQLPDGRPLLTEEMVLCLDPAELDELLRLFQKMERSASEYVEQLS